LIAINRSRAQRAGKLPPDLVGKRCYQALFMRQDPCAGCLVMEIFDAGRSTTRSERRGGGIDEITEWEISTYPILDEYENIIQAILLEQDVTDRRRLETMMAQSEKLAAVGQLAAGVAHEINNPLTAILANAQMLQRRLPVDDELQESVDLIARAGERASQVVRNLLDFARKEEYRLVLTDVNETIQRAIELVQHELGKRAIRLIFEPDPNLPRLMASRDHLSGVWLNLLLNAVDAIDRDGTIRVGTRLSAEKLVVIITDNGSGIPPERINRIFEPFYTTKAPGRGTGLGLSVCHRVVRQHGGSIQVNSQEGVGTEFTVELPLHPTNT
jgi:two-component system NtrC family sensor kinase